MPLILQLIRSTESIQQLLLTAVSVSYTHLDVYKRQSQSYAHEILNGTKPHPSRDYLLALCLGAHMDLKTTQHALRTAQLGELYAKVPRDAAIMMHINNEKWNLIDINIFLEEHGRDAVSDTHLDVYKRQRLQ